MTKVHGIFLCKDNWFIASPYHNFFFTMSDRLCIFLWFALLQWYQFPECTHADLRDPCPVMSQVRLGAYSYSSVWWRHQMETFSALMAICGETTTGEFQHKGQWRETLICSWINGWVKNGEAVNPIRPIMTSLYWELRQWHCGNRRNVVMASLPMYYL